MLAAQLLLAVGVGLADRGITVTNEPVALVSFDTEKIDRISLDGPEDAKVTLSKNDGDWVRLEIRKTLEAKKLLIPVFSSGTDIGKLFSDLPDDCAELSTLNATELVDGQYDAAINKVHSFIEDRATELAEGLVANQQRATSASALSIPP